MSPPSSIRMKSIIMYDGVQIEHPDIEIENKIQANCIQCYSNAQLLNLFDLRQTNTLCLHSQNAASCLELFGKDLHLLKNFTLKLYGKEIFSSTIKALKNLPENKILQVFKIHLLKTQKSGMIDFLLNWKPEIAKLTAVQMKEIDMDVVPVIKN